MLEQPGAARHRIVEQHVTGLFADVAEREQVQVFDLHVEDACRAHPHRLGDAEPNPPVLDIVQPEDIHFDVRKEARGLHNVSAAVEVLLLELLARLSARKRRVGLAAGEAHREAEPRLLRLLSRPYIDEPKPNSAAEAQIESAPLPGRSTAVVAPVASVGGDWHLETELLLGRCWHAQPSSASSVPPPRPWCFRTFSAFQRRPE
jgi:hypothetical protein